jgi:class 3 adenylate cyclase
MTPGRRHDAGQAFAVNGEDAMVTVLFIDLRDFTRFADSATAREAVALLNEFFGVVVPVLESHGGRVSIGSTPGSSWWGQSAAAVTPSSASSGTP